MTTENLVRKLRQSPEFNALIHKRLRVCSVLSVIMVAYYCCFYLGMAYFPEFMSRRLSAASVISIGVYFGITSMLLSVILSGYYTWWSIYRFDVQKDAMIKKLRHEQETA